MCGIAGKLFFDSGRAVDVELLRRMIDPIRHRGPDDYGVFSEANVGLAHRRLTIIDLSSGRQPLSNEDDSIWIVFNGEIYNYRELRRDLGERGHRFKTQSDTEVIVHLYEEYGLDFVERLCGMFGFAIWDRNRERLVLARDRVGIKPLYLARTGDCLRFGSEIKSILADPDFDTRVDERSIDRFLRFYYLPGTATLFRDVEKLAPGHILVAEKGRIDVRRYWDLQFPDRPEPVALEDAVEELDALLRHVVDEHMISDVPVGTLLSGGIDSTAMLSLASEASEKPIASFTIGFDGSGVVDERSYARLAAKRFGTEHYETTISAGFFRDFLPGYVYHMEEPVCEAPAIALNFVSKLARERVKVVISGEGGDEAFAGYSSYRNLVWLERIKRWLGPNRGLASRLLLALSDLGPFRRLGMYPQLMRHPLEDYYFSRLSHPYTYFNREAGSLYTESFRDRVDRDWSISPIRELFSSVRGKPDLSRMLYVDTKTWLPDDLLIKADKITMANSIELRVPLLDHRVLEFAAKLPADLKLRGTNGKFLLKKCFEGRVPRETIERKKAGFPIPYESWFRNELRPFLRELLLGDQARERGYFRPEAIESLLDRDAAGSGHTKELFALVVLELWHRMFIDKTLDPTSSPMESARIDVSESRRVLLWF